MKERELRGASVVLHAGAEQAAGGEQPERQVFDERGVALLEHRLARLHGTEAALVTSGRASALALVTAHLLEAGDSLVASDQLCGASFAYLDATCPRSSYDVRMVSRPWELDGWESHLDERTQMLFAECPSDPNMFIPDLAGLARLAADHYVPLVIDTTVATGALCPAAEHGADLVISSLSGPLSGQSNAHGGAVMGSAARIAELRESAARSPGCALHPFAAFLALLGLETLYDRLRTARENTAVIRQHLLERRAEGEVSFVNHPSLRKHPQHRLARRLMRGFAGPLVCFGVRGGERAAKAFANALELIASGSRPRSGRTTIVHPYSTTHAGLTTDQKVAAVIEPGVLALWIGNEDPADLIEDLDLGFAAL